MTLSKFKVKREFFRSMVAKRVFFLFVLCSLIPLTALAYLAYTEVTKQLYSQASTRLHMASKSAAMSLIERLQLLEDDLASALPDYKYGTPVVSNSSANKYYEHLGKQFTGVIFLAEHDRKINLLGSITDPPRLNEDQQIHIRENKTLIVHRVRNNKPVKIFMIRALDSAHPDRNLVIGEIRQEYLWGSDGFTSPEYECLICDRAMNVLFTSFKEHSPLKELGNAYTKNKKSAGQFTWQHKETKYLAGYSTIFMAPQFHDNWIMVNSQPETDIFRPLYLFKRIFLLVVLLTFLVILFLSYRQIKKYLIPIEILQDATRRIAKKDFSRQVKIESNDEFAELGSSFNTMAKHLDKQFKVLTAINQIGIALSAERDTTRFMEIVLEGAKTITSADGCALYTRGKDSKLTLSIMKIDALPLIDYDYTKNNIPLYDDNGTPNSRNCIVHSMLDDITVAIPDIYTTRDFDSSDSRNFDRQTTYHTQSLLNVPMKNHENESIGVLQLINKIDKFSQEIIPFSEEDQRIIETIASQAAVALSKNQLIEDFKRLFDSLIELIAKAIDQKSPHTGEHCRRVPELTMMLAEAVINQNEGAFKDFTLTEEELYELRVAALLHDCGKVTTPVHIVDKATRLEAIIDRIHLINLRFEIIKRDFHIAFLNNKLQTSNEIPGRSVSSPDNELKDIMEQLEKDKQLIQACNISLGITPQKSRLILREIARKYRWTNASGNAEPVVSDNELYALTASIGTLTPEERKILNQHVNITMKMLESLPYPKALQNVPRFAAVHHERMNGSGYPNGLTKNEIPLQGRIIAIADIFEALTAKNRPYRKAMTLTDAIRELYDMKLTGQIDPDLFDTFISEKVFLRYAEQYLQPEQLDIIDPYKIPGYLAAEVKMQNTCS